MMTRFSKQAIVTAIGLTTMIGAAVPAIAQGSFMHAKIPFAFVAGKGSLPAGEYTMQVDPRTRVLQLRQDATQATYSVLLSAGADDRKGGAADTGLLRFQIIGGQYYLGEVWQPDHDFGNKVSMPKSVERASGNSGAISTVDVSVR